MILLIPCSVILLYSLIKNKDNKFSSLVLSICISFAFLYGITEILSLFNAISEMTIKCSWIVFNIFILVLCAIKAYKNKFEFKINVKECVKKVNLIKLLIAVIILGLIILGIKTVPYNYDSMTYHLPRIMHWIQNGSINHYSSNIVRQITSPSFAEIADLHIYLLSGSKDVYINLLQTISFILNAIIVYFISRKLGCDKKISYLATILALSMPIGFAEALTTQVDNFAALWCLIFTYFILDYLDKSKKLTIDKSNIIKLICIGIALGFGYLTKPTILFSNALFTLYLFIICIRRKDKFKNIAISIITVAVVTVMLIMPSVLRNLKTFNAISDPITGEKQIVHTDKKSYLAINFLKNLLWNYQITTMDDLNNTIVKSVKDVSEKLYVDINDESISEGGYDFSLNKVLVYDHDYAVNPMIMWTLTIVSILFVLYVFKSKFRIKQNISYCIITMLSFAIFIAIMRFQVWETRYEISFLALLCPAICLLLNIMFDKSKYKDCLIGGITIICLISIVNQFCFHSKKTNEHNTRNENYFLSNFAEYENYSKITNIINETGCKNIGIEITEDTFEYPFFTMIKKIDRIEHINVNNSTSIYYDKNFKPEIIISNVSNNNEEIFNDVKYNKICEISSYSIYQINNSNEETELIQLSNNGSRQMMGYLLKTKNGKLVVIDGGTTDDTENLINKINDNGGKVDYWFITHAHDDHAGAFVEIVNNTDIEIDNIYISLNDYEWYEKNEPKRTDFSKKIIDIVKQGRVKDVVKEPSINDKFKIDNLDVEILGIKNPEITENAGNEQSMVIKFNTEQQSILILGDTGTQSSKKLLDTQKEKLDSDIVQMAHHGQAGATKELYEAISPEICLWPTPEWLWNNDIGAGYNSGNWETLETRAWMEELGVTQSYVEKNGDISIWIK